VDDDVDSPERVHLIGHAASLLEVAEVTDDGLGASREQLLHRSESTLRADVNDHSMVVAKERPRCFSA
jgi:hypothetical protein